MTRNLTCLRRRAAALAFQGKHRLAADLYETVLEDARRDPHSAMKLAEIRRKLNQPQGALRAYEIAAVLFRLAGFAQKAEAVDKIVVALQIEVAG